jgi:hypothetical protein
MQISSSFTWISQAGASHHFGSSLSWYVELQYGQDTTGAPATILILSAESAPPQCLHFIVSSSMSPDNSIFWMSSALSRFACRELNQMIPNPTAMLINPTIIHTGVPVALKAAYTNMIPKKIKIAAAI